MPASQPHPYFPRDLVLPHYIPNDKSLLEILGVFFGIVGVFLVGTWIFTGTLRHMQNSAGTRLKVCWFMSCALIHTILEGYFSIRHKTIAGEQTFLAQLWKEYGKGDSRYLSSDTFMVCMESITAFVDGPLSFLAVYAFVADRPYRYVVQMILSLCQLYGDTLYFSTEIMDDFSHSERGHPLYFWFYFVFLNGLWIVIPGILVWQAVSRMTDAQGMVDKGQSTKNTNANGLSTKNNKTKKNR